MDSQIQTLKQGYLLKRSTNLRGDWKRRFFVLDSRGMLYYYRKQWGKATVSQFGTLRTGNYTCMNLCMYQCYIWFLWSHSHVACSMQLPSFLGSVSLSEKTLSELFFIAMKLKSTFLLSGRKKYRTSYCQPADVYYQDRRGTVRSSVLLPDNISI